MFVKKSDIYEVFEYGSGDFPNWFNILVQSGVIKISDKIFPELENNGRTYAGVISGQDFYFGDIFVKKEGEPVEMYEPEEFLSQFIEVFED